MIPFITETLWERLNQVVAKRPFADSSKLLVLSDWPKAQSQWKDGEAAEAMDLLAKLIRAVRDTRNHHGVVPGAKVELLMIADGKQKEILEGNRQTICRLAHIGQLRVESDAPKPADAAAVLISMGSWATASTVLEDFRRDYPDSEFADDVTLWAHFGCVPFIYFAVPH